MKCRDVELLLVELAEGTLNGEDAARAEEHIAHCRRCAADAALLKETFAVLRTDEEELPPAHYFSTLLPTIRTRLEKKERGWGFVLPVWLEKAAAPLTVSAMALVLAVLFRAFEPTEEFSPLKNMVEQVPGDEMASLVVSPTDAYSGDFGIPANDILLEAIPNASSVADKMKKELLADELEALPAENGILTVDKTLEDLDDEAVSAVLDRMNEQPTL